MWHTFPQWSSVAAAELSFSQDTCLRAHTGGILCREQRVPGGFQFAWKIPGEASLLECCPEMDRQHALLGACRELDERMQWS